MARDTQAQAKRDFYADAIKRLQTEMQADLEKWDDFMLDEKTKKLQADYEKFEAKCVAVKCDAEADGVVKTECENKQKEIDAIFFSLKSSLRKRMADIACSDKEKATSPKMQEDDSQNAQARQKAIVKPPIHRFSGSMNNWFEFKEGITTQVIENADLDDEKKMIELIQCCPPELLNEFKTVGFADTWEKMMDKYDNKYRLANFFTQKAMNLGKIDQPSCDVITELLSHMNSITKAYEKIGELSADHILMFVLASKLNGEIARAWQRHRNALAESWATAAAKNKREHLPSLESLIKFLDDEKDIHAEQSIDIDAQCFDDSCKIVAKSDAPTKEQFSCNFGASTSAQTNANSNAAAQAKQANNWYTSSDAMQTNANVSAQPASAFSMGICFLCNKNWHALFRCTVFLSMNIKDRVLVISEHNLCIKCLKPNHVGQCTEPQSNKSCQRCSTREEKVFHNSTLCEKNEYAVRPMQKQVVVTDDDNW